MKNNKIIILLSSILLLSLISNVVIGVENISLPPIQDTYIDLSNPERNYGNENFIKLLSEKIEYPILGGEPVYNEIISYLKFDFSIINDSSNVVEAFLEIYIKDNSENSGDIDIYYCPDDSWDENKMTWYNAPEYDVNKLDSISNISFNSQWYSFDVTDAIISNELDFISFALVGVNNKENISIYSKDNKLPDYEIYKPKLTIYYTTNAVENEPIANFDYSPSNPNVKNDVRFFDKSIDNDGTIISWVWDFGDGTNSTIQNPTKKYLETGVYEISLLVTDNDGFDSTIKKLITISQQNDKNDTVNDNIDILDGLNETENNTNNYNSKSSDDKYFGMFTLTDLLIIILIIVFVANTIVFGLILSRKK